MAECLPSIRRRCAIVVIIIIIIIIIINLIDINIIDDCRHTTVSSRPSPFTSPLSLPSPPSSSLMWQPLLEILMSTHVNNASVVQEVSPEIVDFTTVRPVS